MASNRTLNLSDSENACVVCFKNVDLYSVGSCDHPVCFECSTRMRVLCNQLECPICRQEMPKVIFTKEICPFSFLNQKVENQNFTDNKYGVYFCTPAIQRRYQRLLEHECFICKREAKNCLFQTFNQLKDHMSRVHNLFYCELCVKNLKIFTFERKCYTRSELATHRRKGDVDNTSHRGHPLCEFCETRFMDNDELYRHLRRDHLFCHFCDADGKHQYYNAYNDLRKHYMEEHYLCEEGDCKHERFTSVFRTDIDLKAHYASVHSRNLSKAANRQARTLELEFTLAPRARLDGVSGRGLRHGFRHPDYRQSEEEGAAGYNTYNVEPGGVDRNDNEVKLLNDPLAAENFPSLGGECNNVASRTTVSNVTIKSKLGPLSEENFPSLGGSNSYRQPSVTITRTVRGQGGLERNSSNFPTLRETSSASSGSTVRVNVNKNGQERPNSSNFSIRLNHKMNGSSNRCDSNSQTISVRPKLSDASFPALSDSEPIPRAQWVPQKTKKVEPKISKVAPAPLSVSSNKNDFPTLSKSSGDSKNRKSTSVKVPVSTAWVNLNSFNSDTKTNKLEKDKNAKSSKSVEHKQVNEVPQVKSKKKKKKMTDEFAYMDKLSLKSEEKSVNGELGGNSRKRSEMNVEVSEEMTESGYVEEFPTLGKPPPGFNVKPPPGFNVLTNNIVSNDLTFTNSSGQSYHILPNPQFYPPVNFKSRNQSLIEKFVLKSKESIQQFKLFSDMFRIGDIRADKYYEHCQNFMGEDFKTIFPELLVLLPNVEKQQNLYRIHREKSDTKGLEVCATCKQIILTSDLRNHLTNHVLDNHFPVLSTSSVENNNVWTKK